jgi:hypothetical protein
LIEDLEQQVESEVESRVAAAVGAAVRGAVTDAIGDSRRALAEELNQGVRRLRQAADPDDLYSTLLDVTLPFCDQAAIFSIHEKRARAERMRRPAEVHAGEDRAAASLPALEFPVSEAAAFATALDSRDPVIAMTAPAEVSPALVRLLNHKPDERAYLFPLAAGDTVAGIFYGSLNVQAQPIELFSEVAGLQLRALASGRPERAVVPEVSLQAAVSGGDQQPPEPLVSISGPVWKPPKQTVAPLPGPGVPGPRNQWWDLSPKEQQQHLAAQRFARVQVAEMRLARPDAVRSGRVARDLYGAFKESVDAAREGFREKHMASPTMVDYLHLELVRSLAHDDANLLGPSYPGPLV